MNALVFHSPTFGAPLRHRLACMGYAVRDTNPSRHAYQSASSRVTRGRGFAPGRVAGGSFLRSRGAAHAFHVARASLATPINRVE